jgi:hypothetical protein
MKYVLIILLLTIPQWMLQHEMISLNCEQSLFWERILVTVSHNIVISVQGWALIQLASDLLKRYEK